MSENGATYAVCLDYDGYVKSIRFKTENDPETPTWQGMTPEEAYWAGFSAGIESQ